MMDDSAMHPITCWPGAGSGAGPVRILHCHSTFSLGGKEARAVRLMNAFGPRARHTILSAMPEQMGAAAEIASGIAVDFPDAGSAPVLYGKPGPARYRALARYFQQFDLVLTYNWGSMDAVGAHRMAAPFMSLPPLIHHEDGFNADEAEKLNWKRSAYRKLMLPTAHRVVVPSHVLERVARAHWGANLPIERISNGIAVADYAKPPAADAIPGFARAPGEQSGDVVIGTVAGLRAVKDLPLLVAALAHTPPHVRLVIVGEGPERGAIEAAAIAAGVADRVMLPGFLTEPQRFVGLFDIMALSSLSEQQPIAVMEGMAAGLPIVAPPVGDVAAMVSAPNADYIVERSAEALGAALTRLANDAALRDLIGSANTLKAHDEFDAEQMVQRYASLYAGAIGQPPTRLVPDREDGAPIRSC